MDIHRPSSSSSNSSASSNQSAPNHFKFDEVLLVHLPPPVQNPKFEALPPRTVFPQRKARYPEEVDRDDYYVDAILRLLENAGKIDENFAVRGYYEHYRAYPNPEKGVKRRYYDEIPSVDPVKRQKIVWC